MTQNPALDNTISKNEKRSTQMSQRSINSKNEPFEKENTVYIIYGRMNENNSREFLHHKKIILINQKLESRLIKQKKTKRKN